MAMTRTLSLLAALALCCTAHAQSDYPNKPVRLITPFNPGGAIDIYSRTIADPLGKRLGQNIIVEAIAMTGPQRSASMPELATFSEQGVGNVDLAIWVGAYAPAGTPRPIIDRLQRELKAVINLPEVRERMVAQGQTPVGNTPEEFNANVRADLPKWDALIKASGAKIE